MTKQTINITLDKEMKERIDRLHQEGLCEFTSRTAVIVKCIARQLPILEADWKHDNG